MEELVVPEEFQHYLGDWHLPPIIESDDTAYLSGVTTARKDKPISQHPEEQFHDAFYKPGVYLKAAGLTYENILEMTAFHIDLKKHIDLFFKMKDGYTKAPYPAWTAVDVSGFTPENVLVEMRVVAKSEIAQSDNGDPFLISAQRDSLAPARSVYNALLRDAAVRGSLGVLKTYPGLLSS